MQVIILLVLIGPDTKIEELRALCVLQKPPNDERDIGKQSLRWKNMVEKLGENEERLIKISKLARKSRKTQLKVNFSLAKRLFFS